MNYLVTNFSKIWRIQNDHNCLWFSDFRQAGSLHLRFQDSVLRRIVMSLQTLQDNVWIEYHPEQWVMCVVSVSEFSFGE